MTTNDAHQQATGTRLDAYEAEMTRLTRRLLAHRAMWYTIRRARQRASRRSDEESLLASVLRSVFDDSDPGVGSDFRALGSVSNRNNTGSTHDSRESAEWYGTVISGTPSNQTSHTAASTDMIYDDEGTPTGLHLLVTPRLMSLPSGNPPYLSRIQSGVVRGNT